MAELGKLYRAPDGVYKHREWRGLKDTMYQYWRWLICWKDMIGLVLAIPVTFVKALFRYRWVACYLSAPALFDRAIEGKRDEQLRISLLEYDRIVKRTIELVKLSLKADKNINPKNKLSDKIVLFDELMPNEIMAGFPNLIGIPAQTIPVFLSSIIDQQITIPFLDAIESMGVPADVCPLPAAESGCAYLNEYPRIGKCFISCNMPCDGSVMTSAFQDRYFKLPTYVLAIPVRYTEPEVQPYAVEELKGCIAFIEEQTGEKFDWDAFFAAMKVYNKQTELELQKWEINKTEYPQITGEALWLYRLFYYHLSGGLDKGFLKTDLKVNKLMLRAYERKAKCSAEPRHRAIEWSCPANMYPHFSIWGENCWGINLLQSMETLVSTIIISTDDREQAMRDLAKAYQRTTMRRHTKGGYVNVLDELWRVCEEYKADTVLMYDQISCKGMDGLRTMFEEQARERGIHMIWVQQDLMDPRTISRQQMRDQVSRYMETVMGEKSIDPSLLEIHDESGW